MRAHTDDTEERPEGREGSGAPLPAVGSDLLSPRGVRLELTLLVVFSAIWLLAVLALFGLLPLAGLLDLGLYRLYSVAAVLGWLAGNVYVVRRRRLPADGRWRNRLLLAYLLGPPGVLYLLRALAATSVQQAAPLVPIYSFVVYVIFFLVPVTLRTSAVPRRR